MKVLITRPQPDADLFAQMCRMQGLAPVICPLMAIEINKMAVDLTDVGALAFTSANGVRAFAQNNPSRNLPVFAVGEACAGVARAEGFATVHVAGGDVVALAACIAQQRTNLRGDVLHIAGTRRAGDLVAALASKGIKAQRKVLYGAVEMVSLPDIAVQALSGESPAAYVTLFSPRSADLLVKLVKQSGLEDAMPDTRVICLSEAVADQAKALSWKSVEIAAGRNVAAMIELMVV